MFRLGLIGFKAREDRTLGHKRLGGNNGQEGVNRLRNVRTG